MLFGSRALAQDDKVAKAAVLAREAETLMSQGKTSEACDKLEESQLLDPRGGTLLDLALCREKEGRLGTAYVLFERAEKVALEEKRNDRVTTARVKKNALFAKVPRVTVTVPKAAEVDGMEVRVGLAASPNALMLIPKSEWGRSFPTDSGPVKVQVTAPEKETWEQAFSLKPGEKKAIAVPVLKAGKGPSTPPPPSVTDQPKKDDKKGDKKADKKDDKEKDEEEDKEDKKDTGGGGTGKHESGRVVFDLGLLVGGHLSLILEAPLSDINGTQYNYKGAGGSEFLASCGNTSAVPGAGDCDAKFDPALAVNYGGQIFVGYAITETVQFGGRGLFAGHYPLGYQILGGPSISFEAAKPLWLGFTVVVGTTQATATVTGGKGSVPEGNRADNADESEVDIPVSQLAGGFNTGDKQAGAFGGFEVGATVELSVVLIDNPTNDGLSGSFLFSAWPTGVWSPTGGGAIMLPIGIGYRWH
ncbi:MAG: hypothetical protein HOV80_07195 [Polyangiaceae bacterium]|nr:hypothetical protein [Polyangiaceae bacterium]